MNADKLLTNLKAPVETCCLGQERSINLFGELKDELVMKAIEKIEALSQESPEPITLYIHSIGGSYASCFALYDAMVASRCPIRTVCRGRAVGMAAVILAAGTPGMRYANYHADIILHNSQVGLNMQQGSDLVIAMDRLINYQETYAGMLSTCLGKGYKRLEPLLERDCDLTCEEAIKYGLVDKVYAPA